MVQLKQVSQAARRVRECFGKDGIYTASREVHAKRCREILDAPFDEVDEVLELLDDPGSLASDYEASDLQVAFMDTLARWGRRDPIRMLGKLATRIAHPRSRQVVYLVVGELASPAGAAVLAPALESIEELADDEAVDLASALWMSGGDDAIRLLKVMRDRLPAGRDRAREEVEDALSWFADRASK